MTGALNAVHDSTRVSAAMILNAHPEADVRNFLG
jgi:hypothetical protein